jgi:hypothetical protein
VGKWFEMMSEENDFKKISIEIENDMDSCHGYKLLEGSKNKLASSL